MPRDGDGADTVNDAEKSLLKKPAKSEFTHAAVGLERANSTPLARSGDCWDRFRRDSSPSQFTSKRLRDFIDSNHLLI